MAIIWKSVPGWEGLYEVSNMGIVKSLCRQNYKENQSGFLRPSFDKDCYLKVSLVSGGRKGSFRVNRLVALAFIPNPDNLPIVDHENGVRWDNRADNLKWVTQSENIIEAFRRGTKKGNKKAVYKCDVSGNVIKMYESISATKADGFNPRNVNKVVKGERPFHKGFAWKYEYQT